MVNSFLSNRQRLKKHVLYVIKVFFQFNIDFFMICVRSSILAVDVDFMRGYKTLFLFRYSHSLEVGDVGLISFTINLPGAFFPFFCGVPPIVHYCQ
jgi:hypothetical protein